MLATSVEYVMLSRACVTDMTLFTLMLLGALFFLYGHIKDKGYSYLLSAAFFALAVLTKGPIAVMLPGLAFILYFILTKDWKSFTKIPFLGMAAVFIAVAAPWYIAMYKVHGSAFIDAFFGFQNVTRFMQAEHKIGSQVYYNIPILLGGFFPWSVFLPFGLWHAWKKARHSAAHEERRGYIFALIWFFSIFLFFTASSTKLPTYIFPCFLAAAFLAAAGIDDFLGPKPSEQVRRNIRGAYYSLMVIVVLGITGAGIYLSGHYPSILKSLIVPCAMLLLGFAMSLAAFIQRKKLWAIALIAYAMILFMYPITKLVLPELDGFETSKIVGAKLNAMMSPGERVGSESRYMEGIAFYTGRIPQNLDKHGDMVNFLAAKDRVWGVLKEKNHIQLYTLDDLPLYEQDTYMVYKLGKRAIVTNKMPADGRYLVRRGRAK